MSGVGWTVRILKTCKSTSLYFLCFWLFVNAFSREAKTFVERDLPAQKKNSSFHAAILIDFSFLSLSPQWRKNIKCVYYYSFFLGKTLEQHTRESDPCTKKIFSPSKPLWKFSSFLLMVFPLSGHTGKMMLSGKKGKIFNHQAESCALPVTYPPPPL